MAKNKTVFVCNECGYESAKWLGKCPACGSWNTFFEQKIIENKNSSLKATTNNGKANIPQKLNSYEAKETIRTSTGFEELDRVLGGGLVKGSLILLGGEPGIGKSTLILQLCDKVQGEGQVLYVSGEESAEQIKLRADRLRNKKWWHIISWRNWYRYSKSKYNRFKSKISYNRLNSNHVLWRNFSSSRKCKSSKRNNFTNNESM